jgi:hypothetical protein
MKQEIYDLRQRQRDYSQLSDQLRFLDGKYRQAQDERVRLNQDNDGVESVGDRELVEDEPEFRLHPRPDKGAGHTEDLEP